MSEDKEAMGVVHWDFRQQQGHRISGSHTCRTLSEAQAIVQHMNAEWGYGTHWVEALNEGYSEHHERVMAETIQRIRESEMELSSPSKTAIPGDTQ